MPLRPAIGRAPRPNLLFAIHDPKLGARFSVGQECLEVERRGRRIAVAIIAAATSLRFQSEDSSFSDGLALIIEQVCFERRAHPGGIPAAITRATVVTSTSSVIAQCPLSR